MVLFQQKSLKIFGIFLLWLKAVQLPKLFSYPLQRREMALFVPDTQRSKTSNQDTQVNRKGYYNNWNWMQSKNYYKQNISFNKNRVTWAQDMNDFWVWSVGWLLLVTGVKTLWEEFWFQFHSLNSPDRQSFLNANITIAFKEWCQTRFSKR